MRLPYPDMTGGADKGQNDELRRYLFRIVEQLNATLMEQTGGTDTGGAPANIDQAMEQMAAQLKGEIVKHSKDVDQAMEQMAASLRADCVEKNVFDAFRAATESKLTEIERRVASLEEKHNGGGTSGS